MILKKIFLLFVVFLLSPGLAIYGRQSKIILSCDKTNDLYTIIKNNNLPYSRYASPEEALKNTREGDILLILADNYPTEQIKINEELYRKIEKKNINAFIEYPSCIPQVHFKKIEKTKKERVVIYHKFFQWY